MNIQCAQCQRGFLQLFKPDQYIITSILRSRIFDILLPSLWILSDVVSNRFECFVAANDVVVVTTLPELRARRTKVLVHQPCCLILVETNDSAEVWAG